MSLFKRNNRQAATESATSEQLPDRSFPTEGYFVPVDEEEEREYEACSLALYEESRALGTFGRSRRATLADRRVERGPTEEDRDNIPYIQEAWAWADSTTRQLGFKPGHLRHGVILDCLTRMRAAALIVKRNDVWWETAYKVVGLDFNRILAEHNAEPKDVQPKLMRVGEEAIEANCRNDDWDYVVWGDIDPWDPKRKLKVWTDRCDGCGKCAQSFPDLFAMGSDGKAIVIDPKAPRDPTKEGRCLEAIDLCMELRLAIILDTRGTIDGFSTERGKPLPGQLKDAK